MIPVAIPQANCIKNIRTNHPNAEKLPSDKQREWRLDQLGKERHGAITGAFTAVKRKHRAGKAKTTSRGHEECSEALLCTPKRKTRENNCLLLSGQGKHPGEDTVRCLMPFLCLYKIWTAQAAEKRSNAVGIGLKQREVMKGYPCL